MAHYLIEELSKAGIISNTPESISFIIRKIHNESKAPAGMLCGELHFSKKLVSDEDVLEYYAVNGNSGGLIFTKAESYDPLFLMWILAKKGLSFDRAKLFLSKLEG